MHKAIGVALACLILGGLGYWLYTRDAATQPPGGNTPPFATSTVSADTESLSETEEDYIIDLQYPRFGIAPIDEYIESEMRGSAQALRAQALADKPASQGFRPYELVSIVDATYRGTDVTSARLVLSQDFGGAHPLPIIVTYTFHTDTGAELALGEALDLVGLSLSEVAARSKQELAAQLGDDIIAPEGADPIPENYQAFFVDADSVTFIFQPYQVGPYAAGAPEVEFARVR